MKYKSVKDISAAKDLISPPGDTLLETIGHKGISQTELAQRMGRPLKTINEIIMGKTAIMPETALQLERVIGIPASFWLERERLYRLELAEIKDAESFLASKDWVNQFPVTEMLKLSWIECNRDTISLTNALLRFFSVADQSSYDNYYQGNLYSSAFRISERESKNSHAIVAWLRRGDIQAESIDVPVFDARKFKAALPQFKELMAENPSDFFLKLQTISARCGVKVLFTPCLPKAPISGATRWQNDTPLIQLTGRYNRNDIFWFTFFHEAGHIILHGKKDVFLEGIGHSVEKEIKEKEADDFAIEWTLTGKEEREISQSMPLTAQAVSGYAKKYGTHEALIIGRMAKLNYIHDSIGWTHGFFQKVELK